ncbi:MAG: Pyridine nucleotide-disulfide oxidoreductase [Thermoleophilia bacterium]|nr:Pyridine nucleotide-disulfide oxidoreductase [Thermoleophilia bacterium]
MSNDLESHYDLIVIGAGPAGGNAVSTAAKLGARVLQVEADRMGGTCLNYGCDPTKALLHIAQVAHQARSAGRQGLVIPTVEVDWPSVRARVREVQHAVQGAGSDEAAQEHVRAEGADVLKGHARFTSPGAIEVDGRSFTADAFIVATGTRPAVPDIEGLRTTGFITNRDAHALDALPRRLAIVGGGPIGVEYAQLYARLGVEVTVIEETARILPADEPELAEMLADYLRDDAVRLRLGCRLVSVEARAGAKRLTVEAEGGARDELDVDEVLVAIGREPVTDDLGLDAAGVRLGDHGGIEVDGELRTSVATIFAVGDVLGDPALQFTHVASDQGEIAARNALAQGALETFDSSAIPWTTYTDPAVAHLGRMESELQEDGVDYEVEQTDLTDMTVALSMFRSEGLVKVLVDADRKVLGAHILAPNAGDLIAPLALLMRNDLPIDLLQGTLMAFPSLVGAVRTTVTKVDGRVR